MKRSRFFVAAPGDFSIFFRDNFAVFPEMEILEKEMEEFLKELQNHCYAPRELLG